MGKKPFVSNSIAWWKTPIFVLFLVMPGCGGGGSSPSNPPPSPNPSPSITSLSPDQGTAGSGAFTLTVNGSGFISGSRFRWNGGDRSTTFVSATQLQATITAADIATGGTAQVTVFNPAPGGGTSNTVQFTVNNPAPTATSLSPSSTLVQGPDFTLTVTGSGFVTASVVRWNGSDRPTTFVSVTELQASITATDIATGGTVQITVFNPTPQGGVSSSLTFTVNNPVPSISLLSPAVATAGGGDFTLQVGGANFLASSVVRWNSFDRPTTFVSETEVQAAISASDIAVGATPKVSVFNPMPGGGESNLLTFTVNNPPPILASVSPQNTIAGGPELTLIATGTGFVPTSVVRWNNMDRPTVFVSKTELNAAITATDIEDGSIADITVFNPMPGGGTSATTTFTINNPIPSPTQLTPLSVLAGGGNFTLTVSGSDFVPSSKVRWNGTDRATIFGDSTLLQATVPSNELILDGVAEITVFSPAPGGGLSPPLDFSIEPSPGAFERVNPVNPDPINSGAFGPRLSADGRLVSFIGLIGGDINSIRDALVRDTCLLEQNCTESTTRASVDVNGTEADLAITEAVLSADGRFVAFRTAATNLVPNIFNNKDDVFVRDRDTDGNGVFDEPGGVSTVRVSVDSSGNEANDASFAPAISANGRFVAFHSFATNLVTNDTNGNTDVFVRDTCAGGPPGCLTSTVRVSVASDGSEVDNQASTFPTMSADGRFIAFESNSDSLVTGDTNGTFDIFLHDRDTDEDGVFDEPGFIATNRVSVDSSGAQALAGFSLRPELSADGRFVAFQSQAINLVAGDTNNVTDVFLRDTCHAAPSGCLPTTIRISVDSNGAQGNGDSFSPAISAAGRFIAFLSNASKLAPNDANGKTDVFVRDTCEDAIVACVPRTLRVSVANDGTESSGTSSGASINANGRFITFASTDTSLVPGATDGLGDVFLGRTGFSPSSPAPVLVSVTPPSATAGGTAFTLAVDGSDFVPLSVVQWNGSDRATIYISRTKLLVRITADDIAAAGTADITVVNPLPGGGTSGALTFTVN